MFADKPLSMRPNRRPGGCALRVGLLASLAFLVAACVGDQQAQNKGDTVDVMAAIPRQASYDCGNDGRIIVEGASNAVRLTEIDGSSYDLPASPPTQTSRFGEGGLALVVEGGEALWMKAGKEPMTCRR